MLKPGGRLVILEITNPRRPPLSTFFSLWFDRLVPLLGTLAGDRDAYTYLPESVKRFPPPEGLALIMDRAGLERIRYTVLAGGIIAIHSGARPAEPQLAASEPMNRSTVPPPVTRVLDAAEAWLPRRMAAVEARLAELVAGGGERLAAEAAATLAAGGKRLRPMLVLVCAGARRRRRGDPRRDRDRARPHGDPGPRRRPRRGAAAARPPDRGRPRRARDGDRGRRPAVLARLRRARRCRGDGAGRQVGLLAGASVGLAQGELAQRRDAFDLSITAERYLERCRLKTARLFECACLIGAEPGPEAARPLATYGREIGLAFQLLDDVLDVTGPPERTGKALGTDLLDGTVTMPLILARERDPALAELDLRALDAGGAPRPSARGSRRPGCSTRSAPTPAPGSSGRSGARRGADSTTSAASC